MSKWPDSSKVQVKIAVRGCASNNDGASERLGACAQVENRISGDGLTSDVIPAKYSALPDKNEKRG